MGLAPLDWLGARPYGRDFRQITVGDAATRQSAFERRRRLHGILREMEAAEPAYALAIRCMAMSGEGGETLQARDIVRDATTMAIGAFLAGGSQVFAFNEALRDELDNTDLRDLTCDEIRTPYRNQYLVLPGLNPFEGTPIDGVMVSLSDVLDDGSRMLKITAFSPTNHEPFFATTQAALPAGRDISDYVEAICDPNRQEYYDSTKPGDTGNEDEYDQASSDFFRMEDAAGDWVNRHLALIVNALLYIDTYGAAQEPVWDERSPDAVRNKAQGTTPGARKAVQALVAGNWTKTRLCAIAANPDRGAGSAIGAQVRTHWRRGHWRRLFREGELTGRTRVRPTIVKPGDDVPPPRLYEIGGSADIDIGKIE